MRPRSRRRRVIALTACAAVLVLVVAGFAIDQARHDGTVARNVALDGTLIGGATDAELQDAVHDTAEAWAAVPVTVETPAGPFDTTLGDLGVALDEEAVAAAARSEGRDGGWLAELWSWLRSPLGHREVALTFDADTASAAAALASAEAANHRDPTEPTLAPGADAITVVPGADGATLDTGAVAQQALDAARRGERTITIAAATVPLPPDVSEARAAELATEANALADQPLGIYLDNKSGRFDADMIRSWFRPAIVDGALEVTIDPAAARDDITGVLGQVGVAPQQLRFEVDPEGKVVIVDGVAGTECCTPESLQGIVSALEAGDERVDLTLASVAPDHDRAWAEQLGITTPIATFTTQHPCCAPRVQNIHRFADLIRGTVILPDETMSANDTVGQRTKERGFVEAPVIVDGEFAEDVGGGVSQFAVTLFNAAFYGGLDIPEYQSHSIYIDRYPYGVESTISWGGPDLKIHNNTPTGVLIWPTYDDTSITVTLYGTPWMAGTVKSQSESPDGECTRVHTVRERTLLGNNQTSTDDFYALYQPSEGVTC
ncbi:MAG: VanW family protein [Acidimicrobiales bacterium]